MAKDDVSQLSKLGSNTTEYQLDSPSPAILETFPNQFPQPYLVELSFPEFTSLCPKTGQPDFGTIVIEYSPDKKCVESKSMKLYFFAWRGQGTFMETITNTVLNHFVEAVQPRWAKVRGLFNARGGVGIEVVASYGQR